MMEWCQGEWHPHVCISERGYGHSEECEFEEDKTCAIDQEGDDECSGSRVRRDRILWH